MKLRLVVTASFLLAAGCADRGLDPVNTGPADLSFLSDFAGPDLTFVVNDLATDGLLPVNGCQQLATFVSDQGVMATNENPSSAPGYAWDDFITGTRSGNYPDGGTDYIYYEFFQPQMSQPVMVPHQLDFASQDEYFGLVLDYPPDSSTNGTNFVATSGSVTVSAVDDTQPTGTVSVQGTNVVLQEVDANYDIIPDGTCIQIDSIDLTAMYDNG